VDFVLLAGVGALAKHAADELPLFASEAAITHSPDTETAVPVTGGH
jgi:hypothetical protein